jgi:hypothetical protein
MNVWAMSCSISSPSLTSNDSSPSSIDELDRLSTVFLPPTADDTGELLFLFNNNKVILILYKTTGRAFN